MCAVTSNEKPVCSHKYCGSTIINKQKELDRNSDPAQLKQKTLFFFFFFIKSTIEKKIQRQYGHVT